MERIRHIMGRAWRTWEGFRASRFMGKDYSLKSEEREDIDLHHITSHFVCVCSLHCVWKHTSREAPSERHVKRRKACSCFIYVANHSKSCLVLHYLQQASILQQSAKSQLSKQLLYSLSPLQCYDFWMVLGLPDSRSRSSGRAFPK